MEVVPDYEDRGLAPMTTKLCVVSRAHLKGGLVLVKRGNFPYDPGLSFGKLADKEEPLPICGRGSRLK